MHTWFESAIQSLLTCAELALLDAIDNLRLPALVLRKERAVGIIATKSEHQIAARESRGGCSLREQSPGDVTCNAERKSGVGEPRGRGA